MTLYHRYHSNMNDLLDIASNLVLLTSPTEVSVSLSVDICRLRVSLPATKKQELNKLASVELSSVDTSLRTTLSVVVLAGVSIGGNRVT